MTNRNSESNILREFGMRNFQLESELLRLENDGYDIGHSSYLFNKEKVVDFQNFEFEIVKEAKLMAEFYMVYYCLENSIRNFISERLCEIHGDNWWEDKVPPQIRKDVTDRRKSEQESGMTIRSEDPLSYTFFGELATIIISNWIDFDDTLKSKKAVEKVLSSFNKIRNVIAHSCELQEDEVLRLKLAVRDWFRIQS